MIDRSSAGEDPFSDLLGLADVQSMVSGEFKAGGRWALRFPPPDGLKFFAVAKGHCWLCLDDDGQPPLRIDRGDVVLLRRERGFVLASAPDVPPIDVTAVIVSGTAGYKSATLGDGADFHQIGGHVRLDPERGEPLARVLPPLIHVRAAAPQAPVLEWLLDRLVQERAAQQPGHALVSAQIAQMMFVQVLRVYLDTGDPMPGGWLRAFADARLLPALRLMHGEPGRAWQLGELARAAAMSRTSFAVRFKAAAGVSPLTYLAQWRMLLAQHALRSEDRPLSALVGQLGYGSESAFSHAFKRVVGVSPAQYRSRTRAA